MLTLHASKRDVVGKAVSGLRRKGFIPAVLYGKGESVNLSIEEGVFANLYKEAGENVLIDLVFIDAAGKEMKKPVLIHDVLRDPLTHNVLHVDFYAVALDKPTEATVPLEFINEAPVEKELHGIVIKVASEIEVEALPQDLPSEIEVSLASLFDFESKIHASDITLPVGVSLISEPDMVIVSVSEPLSEEEIKAMEVEGGSGGVEEVKVETEEKKAKREEEKDTEARK
ncbi:MAG: 50S ribosomal protein L25 [Patescibacteria group bacterium]|nr:50S ribosomal protein L25 [Patescibacteria group bacterium]MDE2438553.1 50S ribosomal protein L25 [Patescibacteria group bacterium]